MVIMILFSTPRGVAEYALVAIDQNSLGGYQTEDRSRCTKRGGLGEDEGKNISCESRRQIKGEKSTAAVLPFQSGTNAVQE